MWMLGLFKGNERTAMRNYVKIPDNVAGTLKNVEENEEYAKTVPERQKKI
jgi:hypothetical protein